MEVFLDFKSPGSYLALAPTLEMARKHALAIRWNPLQTRQESIPVAHKEETRGETHRRVRALSRRATHLKYAAIRDLPMTFPAAPGNTDLALSALLLLEQPVPFVEAAFEAYWVHGCDLGESRIVGRLLADADCPLELQALQAAVPRLEDATTAAQERGIPDAPAYVFDNQVFVGREHLPVIEALLLERVLTS
jgi:2-hydroxychromene-2-carboxylate isomerase